MTMTEILDGLAELGRLRLERERAEAEAAALAQSLDGTLTPAQQDTTQAPCNS